MWGIIPAAGRGTRIQPLAFSKELLPVGARSPHDAARPCAVAEYLVERMLRGGADKLCFVIGEGKSDILDYFGGEFAEVPIAYVVQAKPSGLCDAIFRAWPLIGPNDSVAIGLPDTVWFPDDALARLPDDMLSFLLFPVAQPELFDAVLLDECDCVQEIRVNTLVNAWLQKGGLAIGVKAGESYMDVGTLAGYHAAINLLAARDAPDAGAQVFGPARMNPVMAGENLR